MNEMNEIVLGKRKINSFSRPYIIAEIGVNHGGSLYLAKKMIKFAKRGGADAAKFQSYKAETLASKNSPAYWNKVLGQFLKRKTKIDHVLQWSDIKKKK